MNPSTEMDVDTPAGPLKRSSSAPMINEMNAAPAGAQSRFGAAGCVAGCAPSGQLSPGGEPPFAGRTRRYSASFSPLAACSSSSGPRLTPRIDQIRKEECIDVSNLREVAHERNVHSTLMMSQSWEDLSFTESPSDNGSKSPRHANKMMPLQLNLSSCPPLCSSPSPTRPGFASAAGLWKTTSPTRRTSSYMTRRSLSPIAMRPSQLKPKRKLEEECCSYRPSKRTVYGDRGGLLLAQATSSPLPGSLSSVGTPESVSSADSPVGFVLRSPDSPSPSRPPPEPMNEDRSTPGKDADSVDQSPS